jgi:hypothetical protein
MSTRGYHGTLSIPAYPWPMPARSQRPAPASTVDRRTVGALAILVVIAIAAIVALSVGLGGAPSGSATPSSDTSAGASAAVPSGTPASAVLQSMIPQTVNGTTLTVRSITDAVNIANDPPGRAIDAAVLSLGKQPTDLEIGYGDDASGTVDLTIIGFRISGISPDKLRPIVLQTWLANQAPGVTTTQVNLSGTPATQVSYGDSGADEYLFVFRDSVFVVETADSVLANQAVVAITGVSASPPPGGSAAPSGSPAPSRSAAPSPS